MPQFCNFQISDIKKVNNYFLEALYELKKAEIKSRFTKPPTELLLIHVTGAGNVNSIIRNYFDWRRITRAKFGSGTSFTDDAEYANKYANYNIGTNRALIITKVMVSRTTRGTTNQLHLAAGFDTSVGNDNNVYVKFYDNEMLPMFVIYYNCHNLRSPIYNVNQLVRPQSDSLTEQSPMTFLKNNKQSLRNINNLLMHQLVSSQSNSSTRKGSTSLLTNNQRKVNNLLGQQLVYPQAQSSARQTLFTLTPSVHQPQQARVQTANVFSHPTHSYNQYPIPTSIGQPDRQNNDNDCSEFIITILSSITCLKVIKILLILVFVWYSDIGQAVVNYVLQLV